MKISSLRSLFRKFGGMKAIRFYSKRGLLWPMSKKVLNNPISRHSYMDAYMLAVRNVESFLKQAYSPVMSNRKAYYASQVFVHDRSKIIWFCWLQGIENAPKEIKTCHASILKHLTDRDVRMIDNRNWKDYVELPDYIVKRWKKKQISPAHFTDLLRLQLLIRYGGTWIDATVFCSGMTHENEQATRSYLDADLFMFQYTQPGSNQWGGIGNWFITSCTNNEVLMVLRDMLFAYWKEFDFIMDYYIFHLFFSMLREEYPNEIAAMPYGYARRSLTLVYNWGEQFDEVKWNRLISKVCFHKITPLVQKEVLKGKNNYYHHIINEV